MLNKWGWIRTSCLLAISVAGLAAMISCAAGGGGGGGGGDNTAGNDNAVDNDNTGGGNDNADNGNDNEAPVERSWSLVHSELPSAILSVQVIPTGEVYVVGSDSQDGNGPMFLRYDGTSWTRILTGETSGNLWWVQEIQGEIWMSGTSRVILRYRPSTGEFTKFDVPTGTDILFGIRGLTTDDVWAVGGTAALGVIMHYDGTAWTEADASAVGDEQGLLATVFKVWGPAADDLIFVDRAGRAIHWDGAQFTLQETGLSRTLFTVHGLDDKSLIGACGGQFDGELIELVDGVWTNAKPAGVVKQINGINYGPGGDARAVGQEASTLIRTESGWVIEDNGLDSVNDLDFHAVWVAPNNDAWAVGGNIIQDPLNRGMIAFYGATDVSGEIVIGE